MHLINCILLILNHSAAMKFIVLLIISCLVMFQSCQNEVSKSAPPTEQDTNTASVNSDETQPKIKEVVSLGEKMFILCEACHSLKEGEAHKTGPNLHQIFGSESASKEGFAYSDALKSTKLVWGRENLRQWLANPMTFIPNSNMAFVGIKKKEQQDALLDYLMAETQ